jgi:hypothetical protein
MDLPEQTDQPKVFVMSPETKMLCQLLAKLQVGETVTYSEMSDVVGFNVQSNNGRGRFYTAYNRTLIDQGIYLENVRGTGYRRVANNDVPNSVTNRRSRKLRSQVKRWGKELFSGFDYRNASKDAQRDFNQSVAIHGTLALFSKPQTQDKIKEQVAIANGDINIGDTLKMFS